MDDEEICTLEIAYKENDEREREFDMAWKDLKLFDTLIYLKRPTELQKALEEIYAEYDKNPEEYIDNLCKLLKVTFPNCLTVVEDQEAVFKYAVLLYQFQYYGLSSQVLYLFIDDWPKYKRSNLLQFSVLLAYEIELVIYGQVYRERSDFVVHDYLKTRDVEYDNYYKRMEKREMLLHKLHIFNYLNEVEYVEDIFLMAKFLFKDKKFSECLVMLSVYKKIRMQYNLEDTPAWALYNNNMGAIFMSQDLKELATEQFKTADELQKNSAADIGNTSKIKITQKYLFTENLGIILTESQNCDDGFEVLIEAAKVCPDNPRFWYRIAKCCAKYCIRPRDDIEEEIAAYKEMCFSPKPDLTEDSEDPDSGTIFEYAKLSLHFAITCLEKAVEVTPECNEELGFCTELIPISGGSPMNFHQRNLFLNAIPILQSYIHLILEEPVVALKIIKEFLKREFVPRYQIILAHKYASEACCMIDPTSEADKQLASAAIDDLFSDFPKRKEARVVFHSIWTHAAERMHNDGEMQISTKILNLIHVGTHK